MIDIFNCNWVATRWQQYSTHIHKNNTENDTKQTTHRTTQKLGRVRAVPRLCGFYPGIQLITEEKALKNVPDTNHVCVVYNVAVILLVHFMVHVMLFPTSYVLHRYIITFRSTCMCAAPNAAVCCSSVMSCLTGILTRFITVINIIMWSSPLSLCLFN